MQKFNKSGSLKKKALIGVYAFLIIGIILMGTTYAVYQTEDEVLFINARVGKFNANDIELAMKLDGEEVDSPPAKNSLYTVEVNCDNATGTWDMNKWAAVIGSISSNKVKCEVNFTTPEATLSDVTATSDKTTISLSYTAAGIGTSTTCVYGESNSYGGTAEGTTNSKCSISGLSMDTTYYYKVCAKNSTGQVCKEGSIKTKPNSTPFTSSDVGKYVTMTPTATSYKIPTSVTGYTGIQTINPSELNLWRVIKVNDDGTVEMVSDKVSSTLVYFSGSKGYKNLVGGLNTIAAQYTDGKHVQSTRHMGYSNQEETCTGLCSGDTGYETDTDLVQSVVGSLVANKAGTSTATAYWLASLLIDDSGGGTDYHGDFVSINGHASTIWLYNSDGTYNDKWFAVRPIVTLKSTSEKLSGSGTSSSPYVLN